MTPCNSALIAEPKTNYQPKATCGSGLTILLLWLHKRILCAIVLFWILQVAACGQIDAGGDTMYKHLCTSTCYFYHTTTPWPLSMKLLIAPQLSHRKELQVGRGTTWSSMHPIRCHSADAQSRDCLSRRRFTWILCCNLHTWSGFILTRIWAS